MLTRTVPSARPRRNAKSSAPSTATPETSGSGSAVEGHQDSDHHVPAKARGLTTDPATVPSRDVRQRPNGWGETLGYSGLDWRPSPSLFPPPRGVLPGGR